MGIGVLSISLISKLLGPAEFGRYAIAMAGVALGQAVFSFSAPSVIVHFFTKVEDRSCLVGNGFFLVFSALLLVSTLAMLFHWWGWLEKWEIDGLGLFLMALLMGLQAFNAMLEAVFLGGRNYKVYNLLQIVAPVALLVMVFLLLRAGDEWHDALSMSCAAAVTATPLYVFFAAKELSGGRLRVGAEVFDTYLKYGLQIWSANLVTMALYRAPLFVVEHFCSAKNLGHFAVANTFSEKIWMPGKAVATILFPERSSVGHDGGLNTNHVYRLMAGNMVASFLGMLTLAFVFYSFGSSMFGDGYQGVHQLVLALLPGIVAWSGVTILGAELAGLGMSRANFGVSAASFFFTLPATVWGAQFGVIGIAAGASVGYIVGLGFSIFSYRRACRRVRLFSEVGQIH